MRRIELLFAGMALLVVQFGCTSGSAVDETSIEVVEPQFLATDDDGATTILVADLEASLDEPQGQLSEAERQGLILMREEEKMALDVYTLLADKWGGRPFSNIARAETSHMEAVKTLLDRYGVSDPVTGKGPGEFISARIQKLYDNFVKSGTASVAAALKVGAEIEDLDIKDLDDLSAETERADIRAVYENLTKGSENHLRAFVSVLARRTGETYTPRHIDKERFDKIIGG